MSEAPNQSGRIITFYSYKGGTGRSMAVANVGWMLALSGYKVLAVDWDLEAPGLHRYLHPFLEDPSLTGVEGVLDFAIELMSEATRHEDVSHMPDEYFGEHGNILRYVEPLDCSRFGPDVRFDFICAGRQGPAYSKRLSLFDWPRFYTKSGGERFLKAARERMKSEYDYVLIDSRTGVSDTSGICTVLMPDDLVICFTLNEQSIQGAAAIARSVSEQRREDEEAGRFRIFPVPMRVEVFSEKEKLQISFDYAKSVFAGYPRGMNWQARDTYWAKVEMVYVPFYAFEEIPALFGNNPQEDISLVTSVRRVVDYLTGREARIVLSEDLRKEVLALFERRKAPETAAQRAQAVYESVAAGDRALFRELMLRFVEVGEDGNDSARTIATVPERFQAILDLLQSAGLVSPQQGSGAQAWALTDPTLVNTWETLRRWVDDDRPFLAWRGRLRAARAGWERAGKEEEVLLRGRPLHEAMEWLAKRGEDLTAEEQEFIKLSAEAREMPPAVRSQAAPSRSGTSMWLGAAVALVLFVALIAVASWYYLVVRPAGTSIADLARGALASNNRPFVALMIAEGARRNGFSPELASLLEQLAPLRIGRWRQPGSGLTVAFLDDNSLVASSTEQVARLSPGGPAPAVFAGATGPAAVGGGRVVFAAQNSFSVATTDGKILETRFADSQVREVAISPNGRYAAGASTGLVFVIDAMKGNDVRKPIAASVVNPLAFSPDSAYLAVAATDNQVRVFTYSTERAVEALPHRGAILSLAWSKLGGTYRIATGSTDGARLWTLTTNRPQGVRLTDTNATTAVAFSPNSGLLATAGQDGIRVWSVMPGSVTASMSTQDPVASLVFDPKAEHVAWGGLGELRIWRIAARKDTYSLAVHGVVKMAAYSPDGKLLAATTDTGQVSVFNLDKAAIPTDAAGLARLACLQTDRDLTPQEWQAAFPNEPIRATCQQADSPKELTNSP